MTIEQALIWYYGLPVLLTPIVLMLNIFMISWEDKISLKQAAKDLDSVTRSFDSPQSLPVFTIMVAFFPVVNIVFCVHLGHSFIKDLWILLRERT